MRVAVVAALGSCRGSSLDSDPVWVGPEDRGGQMVSEAQNPSHGALSSQEVSGLRVSEWHAPRGAVSCHLGSTHCV